MAWLDYGVIKTLHILSSTVLFGTGMGTAFQMWAAHRRGDVHVLAAVNRQVVLADWCFTTPAVIVQPLTGLWLVHLANFDPWAPWLVLTYALYLLAGACWLPVVFIQLRLARMAEAAAATGTPLPDNYWRLYCIWFWLGWPAFGGLVVVFWLMVTKPALWL